MAKGCPDCEARLAAGRKRTAKWRAKGKGDATVTSRGGGDVTPVYKGEAAGDITPPRTPPIGGTTLTWEEEKGLAGLLAPFGSRGYRHDPAFWAKMRGKYPGVDLELEAMKLAEWLEAPKNAKALCSKARIDNWLAKAAAEQAAPRTNGTANGVVHQPNSLRHNRQPGAPRLLVHDLEPVAAATWRRHQAERGRLTLAQKLAQARGGAK